MNLVISIITMICMWIFFSQINQLKLANTANGCCSKNTCGTSDFDKAIWNTSLGVSILLTLYVIMSIYYMNVTRRVTRLY